MGGFGSGRWKGHVRKILVEECLSLDVAWFAREGIIGTHNTSKSSLQWSDMSARKSGSVGFTYSFEFKKRGAYILRLRYTIGRRNQREVVNLPILLKKKHAPISADFDGGSNAPSLSMEGLAGEGCRNCTSLPTAIIGVAATAMISPTRRVRKPENMSVSIP